MYIIFGGEPSDNDEEPEVGWLDMSYLRDELNAHSTEYTLHYKRTSDPKVINEIKTPETSLLFIIGFDKNFTGSEITAIQNFVAGGGKVVIADDHGYASQLSLLYGVEFKKYPLIANYDDNASIFVPLAITLGEEEYTVITNEPVGLEVAEDSSINILGASEYSKTERKYSALDINNNNNLDGNDIQGPIPLAVEYSDPDSTGKILFFSNTGIFTDKQWGITSVDPKYAGFEYQNSEFVQALIPYLLGDTVSNIVYDESKQIEKFSGHIFIY
jgi:hypothetical protein